MTLMEKATELSRRVRLTKEEWVAAGEATTDLPILVYFWRGEELIATLRCPLDRDTGMAAGQLGAIGFSASTLALVFESYFTELKDSPLTGEPWRHQEMQFVCETMPEAQEKGWVHPSLTLSAHERNGDFLLRNMPYRIKEELVEWDEVRDQSIERGQDVEPGGTMFEYLQHAMSIPTISAQIHEHDEMRALTDFLTEEQTVTHSDLAVLKALAEKDLIMSAVFYAKPDSVRAQMLVERLGADHVIIPERS